jgi:hypothetical protein
MLYTVFHSLCKVIRAFSSPFRVARPELEYLSPAEVLERWQTASALMSPWWEMRSTQYQLL